MVRFGSQLRHSPGNKFSFFRLTFSIPIKNHSSFLMKHFPTERTLENFSMLLLPRSREKLFANVFSCEPKKLKKKKEKLKIKISFSRSTIRLRKLRNRMWKKSSRIGSSFLQPWVRTKNLMPSWHVGYVRVELYVFSSTLRAFQDWHKDDAFLGAKIKASWASTSFSSDPFKGLLWLSIKLMENLHSASAGADSWHWIFTQCTMLQFHHVRQTPDPSICVHPWNLAIKSWLGRMETGRNGSAWRCSNPTPTLFHVARRRRRQKKKESSCNKMRMNRFLMRGIWAAPSSHQHRKQEFTATPL